MGKKVILGAALAACGIVAAGNVFLNSALSRKPTAPLPMGLEGFRPNPEADAWFERRAVGVWQRNRENMRLHAWFVPNGKSHDYALLCHGYTSCGRDMRFQGRRFFDMGMNVLMPDARAHGKSDGELILMGWAERHDIVEWIYEILKRDAGARILLYGISMGAATVMMTSGEVLPDNVKLIIEDCGYTSLWEQARAAMRPMFRLPPFPLLNIASVIFKTRTGFDFKEASAVEQVKKCRVPMLFIHGELDDFVPYPMVFKVYSAARCEKQMLSVPEAGHAMSAEHAPELYWRTVEAFVKKHMGRTGENS